MSKVEVDWDLLAPKDAVFYANDYFRNERGDWWDEDNRVWKSAGWTLEELHGFKDYQKRPEALAKPDTPVSSDTPIKAGAIKSDGGSSSYYDIPLPTWLIDKIKERGYIKTEELIEVLGSDFDLGNIIKCSVRINSLKNGVGKEGNSVEYDANKIIYSANRLKERERN